MDKAECEDRYSEPETEEHKQGKKDLYEWIKSQAGISECVLEGWISETKQRPDIMFKYNGEQFVLEYQCSPISTEFDERHALYQAAGINDIWILGADKYFGSNKRRKYIYQGAFGFYSNGILSIKPNTSSYMDIEIAGAFRKSLHVKTPYPRMYHIPLRNAGFDGDIFCKPVHDRKTVLQKKNSRSLNRICTRETGYYQDKQLDLYKKHIEEKLKTFSNGNWNFKSHITVYRHLCITSLPKIYYDLKNDIPEYYDIHHSIDEWLSHIYVKDYLEYQQLSNDDEYFKEKLLKDMIHNRNILLRYSNPRFRFLEVKN